LDTTTEGGFLHCDGDQAFNIIKKLITIYSMPTDFDSSLVSILNRLNTLETSTLVWVIAIVLCASISIMC
jgi:hypothetical protein